MTLKLNNFVDWSQLIFVKDIRGARRRGKHHGQSSIERQKRKFHDDDIVDAKFSNREPFWIGVEMGYIKKNIMIWKNSWFDILNMFWCLLYYEIGLQLLMVMFKLPTQIYGNKPVVFELNVWMIASNINNVYAVRFLTVSWRNSCVRMAVFRPVKHVNKCVYIQIYWWPEMIVVPNLYYTKRPSNSNIRN